MAGQARWAQHCVNVAAAGAGITLWHKLAHDHTSVHAKTCCPSPPVEANACPSPPVKKAKACPPVPDPCKKKCPCPPPKPPPVCPPPTCDPCAPDPGNPQLQLRQAHVFFKHSFTTPLTTTPRTPQAIYDYDLVMREHQSTLFPYDKLDACSGEPIDYSDYQKRIEKKALRGGSYPGALTAYGKDEMLELGRRLREKYSEPLQLKPYDPRKVSILSTNIRRTVESARCVMAGLFNAYCLRKFVKKNGMSVPIYVTSPLYNILIPDTFNCKLLKDVHHASMMHPDFIPDIKEAKEMIEEHLAQTKQDQVDKAQEAQDKINTLLETREIRNIEKAPTQAINKFRQNVLQDDEIAPMMANRSDAIEKIPFFWADVLCRVPDLQDSLTPEDMKGLSYLRKVEVEQFEGMYQSGYRYTFYFDSNPYFHNEVLQKEVYTESPTKEEQPSKLLTLIDWKLCGSLLPSEGTDQSKSPSQCVMESKDLDETAQCWESQPVSDPETAKPDEETKDSSESDSEQTQTEEDVSENEEGKEDESVTEVKDDGEETETKVKGNEEETVTEAKKCEEKCKKKCEKKCEADKEDPRKMSGRKCPPKCCGKKCKSSDPSFFTWLLTPVREETDVMGGTIREVVWPDPMVFLEEQPKNLCIPERPFDFISARNDIMARKIIGYPLLDWMQKFCCTVEENAARLLRFSVVGQTKKERDLVTQLAAGPLITTMLDRINRQMECKDAPRLCLYSCHDSTLVALMEALDIPTYRWPPYGANVALEVYEDTKSAQFYVKVLYNDTEKIIRCQNSPVPKWCEVEPVLKKISIDECLYAKLCASDTLKKLNPALLKHDKSCGAC